MNPSILSILCVSYQFLWLSLASGSNLKGFRFDLGDHPCLEGFEVRRDRLEIVHPGELLSNSEVVTRTIVMRSVSDQVTVRIAVAQEKAPNDAQATLENFLKGTYSNPTSYSGAKSLAAADRSIALRSHCIVVVGNVAFEVRVRDRETTTDARELAEKFLAHIAEQNSRAAPKSFDSEAIGVIVTPPRLRLGFDTGNVVRSTIECTPSDRAGLKFIAESTDIEVSQSTGKWVASNPAGFEGKAKVTMWAITVELFASKFTVEIPCEVKRNAPHIGDLLTSEEHDRVMESLARDKVLEGFDAEFKKRAQEIIDQRTAPAPR